MKTKGRSLDKALLRATINKKMQTFAHKRLAKDLAEIEKEKIPTVGVTARPLEENLFTWHANIRGPEKTLYEGGVFHLELQFPQSYPSHPPTVKLFTSVPHPNVFENFICLDMLRLGGRSEEGAGWTSAYSAQSILTQLQSFLFEENLSVERLILEKDIKLAVKEANAFRCNCCKHGGKLSCWPSFASKEKPSDFILLEEEKDLIRKEHICFHTKLTASENQLGLGLTVSKVPRTGGIKEAETHFDYLSIKAFIKESVRLTSNNCRITHWLPVYFGEGDKEARFCHFLKRALSMIMTNSTRNYQPEQVLEVFPKLLVTVAYHVMDEKKHPSIRLIRVLTHLHSIFLYCLRLHPELEKKVSAHLDAFLTSQQARNKNTQPNLGCIMGLLTSVDSHSFDKVVETYFNEQLDRQVLWILKAVPELIEQSLEEEADKHRSEIVFKSQMTSFHILCFYKLFIDRHCRKRASRKAMLEEYEKNLCKFSTAQEDSLQAQIKQIQSSVKNFNDFFKYVGLKPRSEAELVQMLKQAIKNSAAKKYHGQFQVIHELPKSEIQFHKLLANTPSYKKYIKVEKVEPKGQVQKDQPEFNYHEEISCEKDWQQLCAERWAWVQEAIEHDHGITAQKMSMMGLERAKESSLKVEDRLNKTLLNKYKLEHIKYNEDKVKLPEINWKQLFLRLDLQDFLTHIDMNPDFKTFYEKLFVCTRNNLPILMVPVVEANNLKSGYYYLTALLSRLISLKHLEFSGAPIVNSLISDKASRALKKGFANFKKAKGFLEVLSFNNVRANKDLSDQLFQHIVESPALTSLTLNSAHLLQQNTAVKFLSNALTTMKGVQQIVLINCNLNKDKCKILADSLMRMKQLKTFTLKDTSPLGQGISSIVYNLAFSPNLTVLNIGSVSIGGQVAEYTEAVESLQKLLKISCSLQVLYLNKIYNFNQYLNKDFWAAVGNCRTLRVLDVSESGDLTNLIKEVGKSVALNAKRKGQLEYLNLTSCLSNTVAVDTLYNGMCVSEYDEEEMYGDPNKLAKMIPSNYKKEFFSNLRALQIGKCNNLNPAFNLHHHNKLLAKTDPNFAKIIEQSQRLETVQLYCCGLQRNIADVLVLSLDTRRNECLARLKVLDLSRNNLGKEGIRALAEVLPHNVSLQVLDLSKNSIGVSGAHELAIALRENQKLRYLNLFNNRIGYDGAKSLAENVLVRHPTLQLLEVGHNRIRDKGLDSISKAIFSNPHHKLRVLGVRFSFITSRNVIAAVEMLAKAGVEQIFLKNNLIQEATVFKMSSLGIKVFIDVLDRVNYLEPQRAERTVWLHPIAGINLLNLKKFFETTKCGIVLDIRVRKARKYPNRGDNCFGFVEFADAASVAKTLHLASKKLTCVDGVKFRVFKSGTGTFLFSKKTAKQKKLEAAVGLLPVLPANFAVVRPVRALRGRGGARGGRGGHRA